VSNPFDPTQQHPQNPEGSGDEPTQFVPPQGQPGQPFGQQPPVPPQPGQPVPGQPWPGQQPYPGQQYPGQQYPGQQPYPGQPYPGAPQQSAGYPAGFGGATPPPGMPPAPGGYPGQPGGQPPNNGKKAWLIGGGVAVVAIIAVVAVVLAMTLGGSDGKKQKPAPTAAAKELLLTQADFPHLDGGDFTLNDPNTDSSTDSDTSHMVSDNPECQTLINADKGDDSSVDQQSADLDADSSGGSSGLDDRTYSAEVKKTIDPDYTTNFDHILSSCGSFSISMTSYDVKIKGDVTMKRLKVDGVDGDYNGVEMDMTMRPDDSSSDMTINAKMYMLLGVDRSVSYSVNFQRMTSDGSADADSDVNTNLASMMNKQRQKILDAS